MSATSSKTFLGADMGSKEMSLEEHMEYYVQQGIDRKEAMKQVAKDRGISKRDVYQELLKRG